jgi:hypothetical protein
MANAKQRSKSGPEAVVDHGAAENRLQEVDDAEDEDIGDVGWVGERCLRRSMNARDNRVKPEMLHRCSVTEHLRRYMRSNSIGYDYAVRTHQGLRSNKLSLTHGTRRSIILLVLQGSATIIGNLHALRCPTSGGRRTMGDDRRLWKILTAADTVAGFFGNWGLIEEWPGSHHSNAWNRHRIESGKAKLLTLSVVILKGTMTWGSGSAGLKSGLSS